MTFAERIGAWIAHGLLGGPWGERISYNLARVGLHGLGMAVPFDLENSGEKRLYSFLLKRIPQPDCLDVGANVGDFTTMLAQLGAKSIIAIEPVQETFERLVKNTDRFSNVKRLCCAVGERDEQITIDVFEDQKLSALSSRDLRVTDLAHESHRTETVPLRSIDSLVEENGWHFDIIKIDVEGFELEVLEGASGLLARDPPTVVQFEFNAHHGRRGHHLTRLTGMLPGYDVYRIAPRCLRRVDPNHYLSSVFVYQNILAVRRDRIDLIAGR